MTTQALQTTPTRLSQSTLWERQRGFFVHEGAELWTRNVIPRYITSNPFIAHAYAEILLAYFEDRFAAEGEEADASPVHVIELGAGSGQFSFHFLKYFVPLYAELTGGRRGLRYVMTDISGSNVEGWPRHEQLRPFVEAGVLDFALFDACRDEELHLLAAGECVGRGGCIGPTAFIANYVFDCLPQDAFEVSGGELFECVLESDAGSVLDDEREGEGPPGNQAVELSYHPRPCAFDFYEREDWNEILRGYGEHLREGAFLFPVGALRCVEKLSSLSGGQFLLLAADKGPHHIESYEGRGRTPLVRHGGCFSFDVNFHALAEHARRAGARVMQSPKDPSHLNVLAFAHGCAPAPLRRTEKAFARHISEFGPDDFYSLMSEVTGNSRGMSLDALTSLLRLSRFDPLVVINCYERLLELLPAAGETARRGFYEAMRAAENCCFRLGPEPNPDFYFGTLAGALELHEEAIAYYRRAQECCDTAGAEHNLGMSYLLKGDAGKARRCFARARLLDPKLPQAAAMSEKMEAWLRAEERGDATRLTQLEDDGAVLARLAHPEVRLEPLLPQHAEAFHEHATPEILGLTRLPAFANVEETRGWIRALASDTRNYSFAIAHREHGLIGVVSLMKVNEKAGRFFFWLGGPFTGRGYATSAVCRLLGFALDRLMLDELFTCVLPHNECSIRVLRRLGFQRIEVEDGHGLHYYRKGVERLAEGTAAEHMRRLLSAGAPKIVVKQVTLQRGS